MAKIEQSKNDKAKRPIRLTNITQAKKVEVLEIKSILTDNDGQNAEEILEYYSLDGRILARTTMDSDLRTVYWDDEIENNEK